MAFSIGYVGSVSRHLGRIYEAGDFYPIVQAPGATTGCTAPAIANNTCGCPPNGPACRFWPGAGLASKLTPSSPATNPNWSAVNGLVFDADASYNSLEATLQRSTASGLNSRVSYTHENCITDSSGETTGGQQNAASAPDYTRDVHSSRGRCGFTASDVFNLTLTYDIPGGKSFKNRFARTAVSGWQISSLTAVSSGIPLNVLAGIAITRQWPNNAITYDRPNYAPGCNAGNSINPGSTSYIKSSCFVLQNPGYLGNVGANTLTGPWYFSTDMSLKKNIAFKREGMGVQLQADMFNIFNRTNFALPNSQSGAFNGSGGSNGAFGQITGTIGTSRQIQLGGKFSF